MIQLGHVCTSFAISRLDESLAWQSRYRAKKWLKVILTVSMELIQISWLIYGNILFYSKSNNCSDRDRSLSFMMLMTLIIGYFSMLVYAIIAIVVVLVMLARLRGMQRKQVGSIKILRSLTKSKFNYDLLQEDECIICWNKYTDSDDIVKLRCNEKHFFHALCIESWIKGGNNTCPMCRQPIDSSV